MASRASAIIDSLLAGQEEAAPQAAESQEPDPQRTASNLERILNALLIPNNASAGAAKALMENRDPLVGALEGVRQRTTYGKLLAAQGIEGPVAGALGLGLDVLLDPTTYLGVGELTRAGQAAKAATRGLNIARFAGDVSGAQQHLQQVRRVGELGLSMGEQARRGQRSLLTFAGEPIFPQSASSRVLASADAIIERLGQSDVGQALSSMFRSVEKQAPETLRIASSAARGSAQAVAKRNIDQMLGPAQVEVKRLARAAGVDYKVAASIVAEATQKGRNPGQVVATINQGKQLFGATRLDTPRLAAVVNSINAANAYAITAERSAGLKISDLIGPINYLKRAITPEALAAVRKANPGFAGLGPREFATEYGAQIMRDPALRDLTISEINELARQGLMPITRGIKIPEFFYEDPFIATAYRLTESARAVATADFLRGASRLYGVPASQAPKGYQPLTKKLAEHLGIAGSKDVEALHFPREVANLLDSHYEKILTPTYLQGFLRAFDKLQSTWKALTLPIWPSYHARNLVSDTWMITAVPGGIPIHRLPERATQAVNALRGTRGTIRIANRYVTYRELREMAEEAGLLHVGLGRDVQEMAGVGLSGAVKDPFEAMMGGRFMRGALAVGETRENLGRLTYFIERLARGEHPSVAAFEVKKRLFDYGDLSPFEKQVMRRIFPFYSWARHNIPFQLGYLFRRPGYGATFQKLREETGTAFGAESPSQGAAPLPQFLARGVPVPLGQTQEGLARFARTQNIIPLGDVSQVASPAAAGQMLVDQLSPFPKAAAETAANYDLFRNRPLERFRGESQSYLGVPVPARLSPLLDLMRPIAELNRMNPGNIFGTRNEPSVFGISRTQPDVSGRERIANYLLARTYEVDPAEQMNREVNSLQAVVRQLEYFRLQALQRGDAVNAQAAEREIERVLNNPSEALGLRR